MRERREHRRAATLGRRWAVVLAGGEGRHPGSVLREGFGLSRPKPFRPFLDGRTPFEETLRRVHPLVPSERTLAVITRDQEACVTGGAGVGRLIVQPFARGSAPAILLAAASVMPEDPEATLLVLPSDHFVSCARTFARCLEDAAGLCEEYPDRLAYLGAVADGPETDYGWIEPEHSWSAPTGAMKVRRFKDGPDPDQAEELFRHGGLWNTRAFAAKVRTLWELGRAVLPEAHAELERLLEESDGEMGAAMVEEAYERLLPADFCLDLIGPLPERALVQPLAGVEWSDLGSPARVERARRLAASVAPPCA